MGCALKGYHRPEAGWKPGGEYAGGQKVTTLSHNISTKETGY